jgi:5-methyltetrahydrofolate corrinoid/iron sulfur protein methyltransferase
MGNFITIGDRIHCISPVIKTAMETMDPEPILKRAREQIAAGAVYLEVNIGPAEKNGPELMRWAVKLLQENCDNVPLCLDTANKKAIEAGISVYNAEKGRPVINSADPGDRISYIDLAAANGAICIALCAKLGVPSDNDERMTYCQEILEHGLELGMEAEDIWFDPVFLIIKGMQDKQLQVLEFIRQLRDMGLNSTGGLSNVSNMMPKNIRPIMESVTVAMAINNGLTSAIMNPCDQRIIETIKSAEIIMNNSLYADSYLEI